MSHSVVGPHDQEQKQTDQKCFHNVRIIPPRSWYKSTIKRQKQPLKRKPKTKPTKTPRVSRLAPRNNQRNSQNGNQTRRTNGGYQLWHFLLEVLFNPITESIIRWTGNGLEFVIIEQIAVFSEFHRRKNGSAENVSIELSAVRNHLKGLRDEYYRERVAQLKPNQVRDRPYIEKQSFTGGYQFVDDLGFISTRLNWSREQILAYIDEVCRRNPYDKERKTSKVKLEEEDSNTSNSSSLNPDQNHQPLWDQIPDSVLDPHINLQTHENNYGHQSGSGVPPDFYRHRPIPDPNQPVPSQEFKQAASNPQQVYDPYQNYSNGQQTPYHNSYSNEANLYPGYPECDQQNQYPQYYQSNPQTPDSDSYNSQYYSQDPAMDSNFNGQHSLDYQFSDQNNLPQYYDMPNAQYTQSLPPVGQLMQPSNFYYPDPNDNQMTPNQDLNEYFIPSTPSSVSFADPDFNRFNFRSRASSVATDTSSNCSSVDSYQTCPSSPAPVTARSSPALWAPPTSTSPNYLETMQSLRVFDSSQHQRDGIEELVQQVDELYPADEELTLTLANCCQQPPPPDPKQ